MQKIQEQGLQLYSKRISNLTVRRTNITFMESQEDQNITFRGTVNKIGCKSLAILLEC